MRSSGTGLIVNSQVLPWRGNPAMVYQSGRRELTFKGWQDKYLRLQFERSVRTERGDRSRANRPCRQTTNHKLRLPLANLNRPLRAIFCAVVSYANIRTL